MRFLKGLSTEMLVIALVFLGAVIALIWVYTRDYFFNEASNLNIYDVIMLSATFLIEGLTGFVFILRKEAWQIIHFKGKKAVIFGILILSWCWLIVAYIILHFLGWVNIG